MSKNIIINTFANIDTNELALLAGTITLFYFSKKDIGPYILNKLKEEKRVFKYFDTPKVKRNHVKKLKKFKNFNDEINLFNLVMINNFKTEDLSNFYNNIGKLKLKINYKLYINNWDGLYNAKDNKISTIDDKVTCIYHELVHMASSTYKNGVYFSGFKQSCDSKAFCLGTGLNEGYTQLLTERYFGHLDGIKGNYLLFVQMASQLEKIIGQEKMESLYLNANLPGLIEELKKYVSEKEILNFIYGLDFLFRNFNAEKLLVYEEIISKTLKNSNLFLFKLYTLKQIKELETGKIDDDELNKRVSYYTFKTLSFSLNYIFYNKEYMTMEDVKDKVFEIMADNKNVQRIHIKENSY